MKKWLPICGLAACLMMSSAAPASAYTTYNTPGNEIRHGVNEGINTTNRALGTDMNYVGTGNNVHTNNYRPYATTTNKGFNWGWLGLLGLFGLAGMRSHNRDRDRA
ncbi:WGxxGxxG-CTERM domain-containing protein [Paenibacillus sp. PR3]|uniref:WGxxGxxG-CTERM domain-containing protein n=1 Tax=Paenibacillus terricola TaxID=2763503 RepID=A0ABR8MVL8_9BACL|nr:WGxxGxxG family protein [Paenibacillus terricola]MBD3920008.1 WGxxGxxG-CTERM domain-containing protein [Paenibacillus terricola]